MIYGLWDTETNNLVGDFDNERDALALVLRAIDRNGPQDADTLALDVEDEHGDGHLIASGHELVELARQTLQPARSTTPIAQAQTRARQQCWRARSRSWRIAELTELSPDTSDMGLRWQMIHANPEPGRPARRESVPGSPSP